MNLAQFRHEMRANLTPVYTPPARPARPGIYLVTLGAVPSAAPHVFSYWTGRRWSITSRFIRAAWQNRNHESGFQKRAWQGLVRH